MDSKWVIVTGTNGDIGHAISESFKASGFLTLGIDIKNDNNNCDKFIQADLDKMCRDSRYCSRIFSEIEEILKNDSLHALVNNAAIQILKSFEKLNIDDWNSSINVNLLAPFLLSKELMPKLESSNGSIVNISSIHTELTKPGFTCYSTSKSALTGLTKAMSVDLGPRIRVNEICPAAVDTQMLRDGFNKDELKIEELKMMHPSNTISQPIEIANLVKFLTDNKICNLTGTSIFIDGAISNRLHDPD